jgi:hypothetical protein
MGKTAIEICRSWFAARRGELIARSIELEASDSVDGKAIFLLYAPRHLIEVSVWDHACCLDVLAFYSSTEEMVFSEGGSCQTPAGVNDRLERFWAWYVAQQA